MQAKTTVEAFRADLRALEREIVRELEHETSCCGVTLAQCHAILELSGGPMSLSGLAAALDLDASTISRTVDQLVRAGLVERIPDEADRRAVRLRLSEEGHSRVAAINRDCNRHYETLLGKLDEKDRRCVIRAIGLLTGIMREFRAGGGCCKTTACRKGTGNGKAK